MLFEDSVCSQNCLRIYACFSMLYEKSVCCQGCLVVWVLTVCCQGCLRNLCPMSRFSDDSVYCQTCLRILFVVKVVWVLFVCCQGFWDSTSAVKVVWNTTSAVKFAQDSTLRFLWILLSRTHRVFQGHTTTYFATITTAISLHEPSSF